MATTVEAPVKRNHRVPVVRIPDIEKHPNADTLGLIHIGGYQVVVKLGEFEPGQLAYYIQPDSVVPEREPYEFLWKPRTFDGPVPEKYRRITARRFRGEWSEGLLMPLTPVGVQEDRVHLCDYRGNIHVVGEGHDVAAILDITHYEPPEPLDLGGQNERGPQYHRFPRSLRGWFYYLLRLVGIDLNGTTGGNNERGPKGARPVYDVDAYKNFVGSFQPGEPVILTEKIHGSNMRVTFDGKKLYVGSRKLWKSPKSACVWRRAVEQNPWIETWCREHPDYTLYGEVVPTQGGYTYGCSGGAVKFFVFDILDPDEQWVGWDKLRENAVDLAWADLTWVPVLYEGPFDDAIIKQYADGPSTIGSHRREGVVIRPFSERHIRNLGRLLLKVVSNEFLAKAA